MAIAGAALNLLKTATIGAAAGYVQARGFKPLYEFCLANTSKLGEFVCLSSSKFHAPIQRFTPFLSAISKVTVSTGIFLRRLIPDNIVQFPNSCQHFFSIYRNIEKLTSIAPGKDYLEIKEVCCKGLAGSKIQADALAEELIFRLGIQKIALLGLSKLLPDRIGKVLSHSASRILITSLIFAFCHMKNRPHVLIQFISGVIDGFIFEKYGIVASTISHVVHNHTLYGIGTNHCDQAISKLVLQQGGLIKRLSATLLKK